MLYGTYRRVLQSDRTGLVWIVEHVSETVEADVRVGIIYPMVLRQAAWCFYPVVSAELTQSAARRQGGTGPAKTGPVLVKNSARNIEAM